MNRPEVRIIDPQIEENTSISIDQFERSQLLIKYGFEPSPNPYERNGFDPTVDLSYQEMIALEDRRYEMELRNKLNQINSIPKSYSIDNNRIQSYDNRFSQMDFGGMNVNVQIQIVTDMKL